MMQILADNKIAHVASAFAGFGKVSMLPGHEITPQAVAKADMLLVRSVTRVDEKLLQNSQVKFVGTATIGLDHIDTHFLNRHGIAFANAPGCNSTAVAEYVLTAMLYLARHQHFSLAQKKLGVIGVGNIGSKVVRMANALGMEVLQNDPPLARKTARPEYLPLEAVLKADIITLHVPLTRAGEDSTFHLFDQRQFSKMRPGSILINTSRGGVIASDALRGALAGGILSASVLDVWENEPSIDTELVRHATLATPHIAGYSVQGKVNATRLIYAAACRFLDVAPRWNPEDQTLAQDEPLQLDAEALDLELFLSNLSRHHYDIENDDRKLRSLVALPTEERGRFFEQLRSGYPLRREFSNKSITLLSRNKVLKEKLIQIGFRVL